jgi:hypothetical protein
LPSHSISPPSAISAISAACLSFLANYLASMAIIAFCMNCGGNVITTSS